MRWTNARSDRLRAKLNIITPNCLKVDRAIIFFISISVIAIMPAISIVVVAVSKRSLLNIGSFCNVGEKRIRRKTPAVTSVEE